MLWKLQPQYKNWQSKKDALPEDRRQMRYRSFVLHNLLKNCVQRRSHRVLQNDLPEKLEFVILVKLTPKQIPYYSSFTKISGNNSEEGIKSRPIYMNFYGV